MGQGRIAMPESMIKKNNINIQELLPDEESVGLKKREHTPIRRIPAEELQKLKNGDHAAFDRIYLEYVGGLTDFMERYVRSREDAEEIVQDTFEHIWTRRESIDTEKDIRRYLFTIAVNNARDLFRRKEVRSKYERFEFSFNTSDFAGDELLISEETKFLIENALRKMPELRRTIFLMSRDEGLSHEQIASALHISKSTVNNNITQATKELRDLLALIVAVFLS